MSIGEWPCVMAREPLGAFLTDARPLSARATLGFVSRAERAQNGGHLTFPSGFLARLRRHLDALTAEAVSSDV